MKAQKVTITNTAAKVRSSQGNWPFPGLMKVPTGGNTVWVGGADVNTTDKGFPVEATETIALDLGGDEMYAVTATTQDVYLIRSGS